MLVLILYHKTCTKSLFGFLLAPQYIYFPLTSSVVDPDSVGFLDPDPDSQSRSVSRRAKITHKNRKKSLKFSIFEVLDVLF